MEPFGDQYPGAWRPLTPRGIAVFSRSSFSRLFLVFCLMGLLASGTVVWVLAVAWYPVITAAVDRLPKEGQISGGRLAWRGETPLLLAENRFLALAVDLDHSAQTRSPAHIQAEFGLSDLRFYSLLGCCIVAYPNHYVIGFNFDEVKPRWGAWAPMILGLAAMVAWLWFLVSWTVLATLYCLPAWLLGLYSNRDLTFLGSWRLSGAALMPGALVMSVTLGLYGLGQLDVVRLLGAFALHLVIGWVYLVLGVLAAPKISDRPELKANPFTTPPPHEPTGQALPKPNPSNPFHPRGD